MLLDAPHGELIMALAASPSPYYVIGDRPEATMKFRDANGTLRDPATVTFMLRLPDTTEFQYVYGSEDEVTRLSTGKYHFQLPVIDDPGVYAVRVKSTGSPTDAEEIEFTVPPSSFSEP